jgi:hypothetical protein
LVKYRRQIFVNDFRRQRKPPRPCGLTGALRNLAQMETPSPSSTAYCTMSDTCRHDVPL